MVTASTHGATGRRAKMRVSQLLLLRTILAFRLLFVVIPVLEYGLGARLAGHEVLWGGVATASAYTIALLVLSRRVLAVHLRNWAFAVIDVAVVFLIYFATGSGSQWPFFLFGSTTVLLAGLRGKVGGALVATVAWNLLSSFAWVAKGIPIGEAFGISSFDDLFNLSLVAAIWAYCIGLIARLNQTEEDLNRSRDELDRMNALLDEREKEVVGLLDVGNAIAGRVDLPGILGMAEEALEGMGFGTSRLWVLEDDHLTADDEDVRPRSIPLEGQGPLREAVRHRAVRQVRPGSDGVPPDSLPGVASGTLAVMVPVLAGQETYGAIVVESRSGEPFTTEDIDLLSLFAEVMALAIRHARFYDRAREQAVAEERHRLTLQMQGTVLARVSAAIADAEELSARAKTPKTAHQTELVAESLRQGMQDIRVAVLNWDSLDWTGGVAESVKRYLDKWGELSGIRTGWSLEGRECGLDMSVAHDLLRILQESLSNAWRHGESRRVDVTLRLDEGGVALRVADDGKGFDAEAAEKSGGVGLRSIRARAERNGGGADVETSPGEGTSISVWVPCATGEA